MTAHPSHTFLRASLALAAAAALCGTAQAAEYGRVISATPVLGDVALPQRQCYDEEQAVPAARTSSTSGVGALVGAVVGGVVGNGIGAGAGRAAATGIGAIAGAAIGDRVEANGNPVPPPAATYGTVRRCQTVTRREQRVLGYDVVYEYQGRQYTARTARDPGERIALNVSVAPADAVPPAPAYAVPPAYASEPPAVVYATPPVYAAPPVVWGPPSVYVAPTIWFGGSWGGHRHWH